MRPEGRESTRAVYVISVAAELAGVHPQTLRIYERKGLVDPARTPGGSRRYSDADIAQLRRIQQLTNEGLNLQGVQRVLQLEAEIERLRAELEETRRKAAEAVAEVHRQYRRELVPLRQAVVWYEPRRRRWAGRAGPRPWPSGGRPSLEVEEGQAGDRPELGLPLVEVGGGRHDEQRDARALQHPGDVAQAALRQPAGDEHGLRPGASQLAGHRRRQVGPGAAPVAGRDGHRVDDPHAGGRQVARPGGEGLDPGR